MSLFHVFIERPRSTAPSAVAALAKGIAERYGIPAADLEARLASGRFRVKGNVDRATADSYAHDLARLGAVCTIISADAAPPSSSPAVTLPQVERVAAPPAPTAATPISASSVSRMAAPPPRATPSASWPPADVEIPQELGALSGEFPLTLSTLDGATEDEARASRKVKLPASFAPPAADVAAAASRKVPLPASFGPAPEAPDDDGDIDMDDDGAAVDVFDPFAPPEAQANAPELVLAVDRAPRKTKTVSAAPPPADPRPASNPAHATSASHASHATLAAPAAEPAPPGASPARGGGWKGLLRDDATRLIAGAVLAVAIGALPALLIGSARERASFAQLDGELDKRQSEIRTRDAYDGLDRVRATFVDRKRAERQSIAITSLMIWAVIGGGVAWLWFRKLDWDRILA